MLLHLKLTADTIIPFFNCLSYNEAKTNGIILSQFESLRNCLNPISENNFYKKTGHQKENKQKAAIQSM